MPISFTCSCGKAIVVKDDSLAGKQAKCPACGQVVTIPAPEAPAPASDDDLQITDIAPSAPQAGAQEPAAAASPAPGAAVKCSDCGADIAPGAMFCGNCGAAVVLGPQLKVSDEPPPAPAEGSKKCPGCGGMVVESAVLCTSCGFNFKTGKKIDTEIG